MCKSEDTVVSRIGSENGDYSQLLVLTQIGKNASKAKQQNIIINFHLLHFVQCTGIVQHTILDINNALEIILI